MAGPAGLTTLEMVYNDMRNEGRAPPGFNHSLQAFATKKEFTLMDMELLHMLISYELLL